MAANDKSLEKLRLSLGTLLTRSRETTVTFVREFSLRGVDGPQPGGTYRVVTDEEEIRLFVCRSGGSTVLSLSFRALNDKLKAHDLKSQLVQPMVHSPPGTSCDANLLEIREWQSKDPVLRI